MTHLTQKEKLPIIIVMAMLLVLILGFLLRLIYLQRMILHVDEFLSLLSIKMILEKGVPVLPTGMFHGKGLVFSYLGAGVATLYQFNIEVIRYLSLAISMLTIPIAYLTAFALYRHRWSAVMAAVLMAIHPTAVLWGARARMYSLAELMVFLVILVSWLSLVWPKPKFWFLILIPLTIILTLFSHLVTIVIVPPLLLAMFITNWYLYRLGSGQNSGWRQLIILSVITILVSLLGYWLGQEPGEVRQWREESSILANINRAIFSLRLWRNFFNYFLISENIIATILALAGIAGLGFKLRRQQLTRIDYAAIFVYIQLFSIFLGLYLVVPSGIRDERHNYILLHPFLTLAVAYGALILIEQWPQNYASTFNFSTQQLVTALYTGLILLILIQQSPALNTMLFAENHETYRYDEALQMVSQQIGSQDKLLSVLPPAAYLYKGPLDYYANHHKPRFLEDPATGRQIDYYTGGEYVSSLDDLSSALAQPGKIWFVVDTERLTENYSNRFSQEVLHQMALYDRVDNVLILVEKESHWSMSNAPKVPVQAEFLDQMRLVGYATQLVGTNLRLTLFWEALNPIFTYKVFVHLRDQNGNTVAQADFLPFDNIVGMPDWRFVWRDGPVPTGTELNLSPEIVATGPEQYQIFVGLYLPELNFQRVPLTGDSSGENAFVLHDFGL